MSKSNKLRGVTSKKTKRFDIKEKKIDYNSKKPIFSFHYMKYGGDTCISNCEKNDKASIADTLVKLSQLSWNQIILNPHQKLGLESIKQNQFKVSFPNPPVTPDVKIQVLRHSDSGRIAGYKINDVFHIIHIGPNLYDH